MVRLPIGYSRVACVATFVLAALVVGRSFWAFRERLVVIEPQPRQRRKGFRQASFEKRAPTRGTLAISDECAAAAERTAR